jgi:hypothetical protein
MKDLFNDYRFMWGKSLKEFKLYFVTDINVGNKMKDLTRYYNDLKDNENFLCVDKSLKEVKLYFGHLINEATKMGWKGMGRAEKIFLGNFYLDENNWVGGIWQGFTRHTWEMLQQFVGQGYSQVRNMAGRVDRVDYLGGATFATQENSDDYDGITFGSYINMNIPHEITGDFDTYVTTLDPIFMHEYGHTIDSRRFGLSYIFAIGIPSAHSAQEDRRNKTHYHHSYWTEIRANKRAAKYFGKYYGVNWSVPDFVDYPLNK